MEYYILHRGRMFERSEFRPLEYNAPDIMP